MLIATGLTVGIRLGEAIYANNANTQMSTTQSKFGGSSFTTVGGVSSYTLVTPASTFAFGTGDWTIEFWYYTTAPATNQGLIGMRPASTNGFYPAIAQNASKLIFYTNNGTRITATANTVANTWTSVAFVKNTGNTKLYINGNQSGATYVDTNTYLANRCVVGCDDFTLGGNPIRGYMDELRISNTARYTGNYTVASSPFTDDTTTLLLCHFDGPDGSRVFVDDNS
jgi:hypothetical protein